MLSHIVDLFHSAFVRAEAKADSAAGLKQRLACAPSHQTEPLLANDHLRCFLTAVIRHHEEGRMADSDWTAVALFLMGRREALPVSVAHLAPQWPRARETAGALADLLRPEQEGAHGTPEHTIARLQALLAYLKERAQGESWLSHGFKVEFQDLCRDPILGPLDRIEVVDVVELKLGPLDGEQLRACVQRIARLQGLLPADAYPCIHDALTRISNEASWQLELFSRPDGPLLPVQRCGMSLAE